MERKGRPFTVVNNPEQDESLKAQQDRAWKAVERVQERNADKSPEEVLADVTAEVEAVRQERYEQPEAAKQSSR